MSYTLQAIQEVVGGEITGDVSEAIVGVNALELAQPGELTFAEHDRALPQVRQSRASAVIVSPEFPTVAGKNLLRVAVPRAAFVKAMGLFTAHVSLPGGIHHSAVISPEAQLGEGVTIGECAVVRARARIGRDTVIESGVHVGADARIGEACYIGPNVVIMADMRIGNRVIIHGGTVIGGDGFGYVTVDGHHLKIPQLGNVIIEDDGELGSNVCVDRATFGSTIIRRGTKIDNLVQIAHNDLIGEDVIMTGQVGLAGSVTVGNRAMLGGQSGVVDHITIGEDARIGAAAPVTKDVKPGETVWGFPARPIRRVKRELASVSHLPQLIQQLKALAAQLAAVETRLTSLERGRKKTSRAS